VDKCFLKGLILQLSHELNPQAQIVMYTLKAFIADREVSQVFEVKKYSKLLCKGSSMTDLRP